MLRLFLLCSLIGWGAVYAQGVSVWLEPSLAFIETNTQTYTTAFKVGTRVVLPITETVGVYAAPYYAAGFGADIGTWFSFPGSFEDVPGFSAYGGLGLTIIGGRFGFALSGAILYELSRTSEIGLIYTHRPLLSPALGQAFDVAFALKFRLGD
jgi:hypothetical protein